MPVPDPVYIRRLIHIDNLSILLQRQGLHAPNAAPNDGLIYRTIHNPEIQNRRRTRHIPCGPGGVIHDYVPFYFGARSPMLYQLHTGQVEGYNEGQAPLIYLVSTVQKVEGNGLNFVFSDGHGIAAFTQWFDNLDELDKVDWQAVDAYYWGDTSDDMDRQRRKQAEFLIHRFCPWHVLLGIAVYNEAMEKRVNSILETFPKELHCYVGVRPNWYY